METSELGDYWGAEFDHALAVNVDTYEPGSVRHYLITMVTEYDEQVKHWELLGETAAVIVARVKRDAYADAVRVLDIARDSAYDRATRIVGELS